MSTYPFFPLAEKFYNCSPCYKAILEEMQITTLPKKTRSGYLKSNLPFQSYSFAKIMYTVVLHFVQVLQAPEHTFSMLFLHLVFSPKHQQQPLCWKRVKSVFKPPNNFLLLYLFRSGYRSQGSIEEEDSDFGDPRHRLLAANGSNSGFKRWKNFGNRNL